VNDTGGVPMEMAPYHTEARSSTNGSLPVFCFLILLASGCASPVFLLYAVKPLSIFLGAWIG
jgi:hypothetical protein